MTQESKYAVFLKPIKDLAETWNINVATELEEYLQELASLDLNLEDVAGSSSQQEGNRRFNFAEAALVIQGSAHVYGKKVEFLYNLVFKALEDIHATKKKNEEAGRTAEGAEGGAGGGRVRRTDDATWDDEERFLSLEDLLEEGEDIDLEDMGEDLGEGDEGEDMNAPPSAAPASAKSLASSKASMEGLAGASGLLSGGAGHLLKPPPQVLSLLQAGDRGLDTAGLPKLSSCAVHPTSGALLIDAADGRSLDAQLRPFFKAPALAPTLAMDNNTAGPSTSADAPSLGAGANPNPTGFASPIGGAVLAAGDDSDHEGPAPLEAYDYEGGGGAEGEYFEFGVPNPSAAAEDVAPGPLVGNTAPTQAPAAAPAPNAAAAVAPQEEEEEEDPWQPLDPYAKGPLLVRPLKKGRASRRAARAAAPAALAPGASFEQQLVALLRNPNPPVDGFYSKDLERLDARLRKARRAEEFKERLNRTKAARAAAKANPAPAAAPAALPPALELELENADNAPAVPALELLEEYEYMGGGGDFEGYDGYQAAALGPEGGFGSDLEDGPDDNDGPEITFGGFQPLPHDARNALPGSARRDRSGLSPTAEGPSWVKGLTPRRSPRAGGFVPPSPAALSYEEQVRRHVEQMLTAAASAQVQTQLQRAVGQWREKIEPVLEEQDARPPFDIHLSGDGILHRLEVSDALQPDAQAPSDPAPVAFREVCGTENPWEVSRGFAALLQLINNGNVAIRAPGVDEEAAEKEEGRASGRPQRTSGKGGARQTRLDEYGGRVLSASEFGLVLLSAERKEERFNADKGEGLGGNRALAQVENGRVSSPGPHKKKAKKNAPKKGSVIEKENGIMA